MSKSREIKEALKKIVGESPEVIFTAEVTRVTESECDIKYGEFTFTGVSLFCADGGNLLVKPAKNSMVTVADLSNGNYRDLIIIKVDKADLIRLEHEGIQFEMDGASKKFNLSTSEVNLKDILVSIATILKSLKVLVAAPNSPSGTITPDVVTRVEKFESDINKLMK
jgi:hypothetical protein